MDLSRMRGHMHVHQKLRAAQLKGTAKMELPCACVDAAEWQNRRRVSIRASTQGGSGLHTEQGEPLRQAGCRVSPRGGLRKQRRLGGPRQMDVHEDWPTSQRSGPPSICSRVLGSHKC